MQPSAAATHRMPKSTHDALSARSVFEGQEKFYYLVLCKVSYCKNRLASCTLQAWQENHN